MLSTFLNLFPLDIVVQKKYSIKNRGSDSNQLDQVQYYISLPHSKPDITKREQLQKRMKIYVFVCD
jgi:hypothetical protein